jgi:hypothetical protein
MRPDAINVHRERGRSKGTGYSHYRARLGRSRSDEFDDLPRQVSMRRPFMKGWDDHLKVSLPSFGYIDRFLTARVGRPWTEVFAEVAAVTKGSDRATRRFRESVRRAVDFPAAVFVNEDGDLAFEGMDGRYRRTGTFRDGDHYVDPDTGILCRARCGSYRRRYASRDKDPYNIEVDGRRYQVRGGNWHEVTGPERREDGIHEHTYRTLSKKELRVLGLENPGLLFAPLPENPHRGDYFADFMAQYC